MLILTVSLTEVRSRKRLTFFGKYRESSLKSVYYGVTYCAIGELVYTVDAKKKNSKTIYCGLHSKYYNTIKILLKSTLNRVIHFPNKPTDTVYDYIKEEQILICFIISVPLFMPFFL